MKQIKYAMVPILVLAVMAAGCGREAAPALSYTEVLELFSDPHRICRLDTGQAEMASSVDPSGGNNDFNNFAGNPGDGTALLADLQGPGIVTRFWITGGKSTKQRLRFYFDDEKTPRIDATVDELRKGGAPFAAPLSRYEQSCWWTYVPMPYAKRLRIVADDANFTHTGWPRLFFQVNYQQSPGGQAVSSFPASFSPEAQSALEAFAAQWSAKPAPPGAGADSAALQVAAGETAVLYDRAGPGLVSGIFITPADNDAASQLSVAMTWDGAERPSVDLPLTVLAGQLWNAPRFCSAYFGETNGTVYLRFPMPFREHARIELRNSGTKPAGVTAGVSDGPLAWDPGYGYLHAVRSHSTPAARGQAHTILEAQGRGKYLGCVFAVAGQDPSWWVLEGDEAMLADDETVPGWHGTGLEDYFNGAWYYKVGLTRELHGLVHKRPFSTVQYRLHRDDARTFRKRMHVTMERGPDQASQAWMESLAFCYLDTPAALAHRLPAGTRPDNPPDRFEPAVIMTTLASYERLGDYAGAAAYIDRYLARYPQVPFAAILRLRRIATYERQMGIAAARPLYEAYLAQETDPHGTAFCKLLLWLHEDPSNALVSLFSGNATRVLIDGTVIGETSDPAAFRIFPVSLPPGRHVVGVESVLKGYPDWVHVGVRTHAGVFGTGSDWRCLSQPAEGWELPGYDASAWPRVDLALHEGPPPAPGIATSPHPFVDLQGLPMAVWSSAEVAEGHDRAFFRHTFEVLPAR